MINSIAEAMQGYIVIFNALPLSIKSFISTVLFLFIVALSWKLLWRIKG